MFLPKTITQKLFYCLDHEIEKHKSMGHYKFVSLAFLISFFTLFPLMLQNLWPYVYGTFSDVVFYAIIVILINVGTIGLYNFAMYWVYTLKLPFFEQFRVDKSMKWPWEQNYDKWREFCIKSMRVTMVNISVGVVVLYIDSLIKYDIVMTVETAPNTWTIIWQFFSFLYMEELIFYTFHRTLHDPKLYFLHKQHHEYNVTISLAFIYSSEVEQLSNVIATGVTYKLLASIYPVHIFTVIIWLVFRFVESMDGHCGYEWPWAVSNWVPFSSGSGYHFFHHSHNVGNYGGIVHLFDTFYGTNATYLQKLERDKVKKQKQESQKYN